MHNRKDLTENSSINSLGYAIGKTNWYLKTYMNKLLKEGDFAITNEQWIVLKVISFNPGLSQTEIAEKSMKDKTNITRILDLLEKKAYIERRKDDMDRRMYRIHITDQGKQIINAVTPITQKTDEICKQALQEEEVTVLIKLLDAVCDRVRKHL